MAIYDEPGRGRKQCPGCKIYVGVRTWKCPECGQEWESLKPKEKPARTKRVPKPKPQVRVFDEPGQGRKECASCHKYVGGVLQACPNCQGTEFVKKAVVVHATYDEPGPGRKECASCHKYVGARIEICPNCKSKHFVQRIPTILTYDEPGRRRKQCLECNKYVGSTAPVCACGSTEFEKKAATIVIYDEPGRGRKQCPKCEKYVGRTTATCVCGFDFSTIPETAVQQRADRWSQPSLIEAEASNARRRCGCGLRIVVAPVGKPPVRLKGTDGPTIEEWVTETIAAGHESGYHLSPAALRYYVRNYFHGEGTPELDCCVSIISQFGAVDEEPDDEEVEQAAA